QAPIVDRTKEHLVDTDRGIVMLRDRLFTQMDLIHDGGEPKFTIRDAEYNQRLPLPLSARPVEAPTTAEVGLEDQLTEPPPPADRFPYLAGAPREAEKAYKKVLRTWRRRTTPSS